jgi:hypothetical protein
MFFSGGGGRELGGGGRRVRMLFDRKQANKKAPNEEMFLVLTISM